MLKSIFSTFVNVMQISTLIVRCGDVGPGLSKQYKWELNYPLSGKVEGVNYPISPP